MSRLNQRPGDVRAAHGCLAGDFEHALPADRLADRRELLDHVLATLETAGAELRQLLLQLRVVELLDRQVAQHVHLVALDVGAQLAAGHAA